MLPKLNATPNHWIVEIPQRRLGATTLSGLEPGPDEDDPENWVVKFYHSAYYGSTRDTRFQSQFVLAALKEMSPSRPQYRNKPPTNFSARRGAQADPQVPYRRYLAAGERDRLRKRAKLFVIHNGGDTHKGDTSLPTTTTQYNDS